MVKRYQCGCGSEMNFTSLRRHLKSKKHLQWEEKEDNRECGVCYELKIDNSAIDCKECHNKLCPDCFGRLRRKKCPFCRTFYNERDAMMARLFEGDGWSDIPTELDRARRITDHIYFAQQLERHLGLANNDEYIPVEMHVILSESNLAQFLGQG